MKDDKIAFTIRISSETHDLMKTLCKLDNCNSQNEFVEKAVKFYASYLSTNSCTNFLSPALLEALRCALRETENKNSNNIFRLSVEMSMMMNLLAAGFEIEDEQLVELRTKCIKEVKRTKGRVTLEDAVEFQRGE